MGERLAQVIVALAGAYVAAGLVFAAAFVVWGAARVDPVARNATRGFRAVILPGATALWPLLAVKWIRSRP